VIQVRSSFFHPFSVFFPFHSVLSEVVFTHGAIARLSAPVEEQISQMRSGDIRLRHPWRRSARRKDPFDRYHDTFLTFRTEAGIVLHCFPNVLFPVFLFTGLNGRRTGSKSDGIEPPTAGGGKNTEVTDFPEPSLPDMQAESPEEFFAREEHLLYSGPVPIIFTGEYDAPAVNVANAVIADRSFMGVMSRIID
jgi:hypothetical protein